PMLAPGESPIMKLTPVHPRFGVEVEGVDLRQVTAHAGYPEIRAAFEEHSLLLFRGQDLDDEAHLAFGALFGPIEDRSRGANGPKPVMSPVSNRRDDATIASENDPHVLHLKANQLWHTDSTFLPAPALANILAARVLPSGGGESEFVSTRVAWADMPEKLKAKARNAVFRHRYAHSRAKISAELAAQELFTMWTDQCWRALWRNPVHGREALYIASHVCAVEGMDGPDGAALVDELVAFATQDAYVYAHHWLPGDVLVWDERATMHRGRPWPYDEERTLTSICITAGGGDGLDPVRPRA
ncbi:MAG: TauD/TfdA dioxygenase family protein, partial [Alphaproteobacteria bacterium]